VNRRRAWFLAVVALAVVLYARTLGFSFSHLDDSELVLDDLAFLGRPAAVVEAFGRPYFPERGADHAYYRPLVTASFALDALASSTNPAGYRATNLLLHALVACLLLVLLEAEGAPFNVALFVALAFVAHPALTAAVAWIPGRDDLLLTLFALSTWLALLRCERLPGAWSTLWYGALFFATLASKETGVTLPLVFLGRALLVRGRSWRSALPRGVLGASFAAGFMVLLLRWRALGAGLGLPPLDAGVALGGAGVLVTGLGSLVVPASPRLLAVPGDVPHWPGILAWGLAGYAVIAAPRSERGRRLFGIGAFVLFLLPSLPASGRLVLESRLYLPAVGVAWTLAEVARRASLPETPRLALAAFVPVALASSAWRLLEGHADRSSFAEMLAVQSPHSALAARNLGVARQLAGDVPGARRAYARALAADPDEPLVHNNLGVLFMAEGKLDDAERELRAELARDPDTRQARDNLERVARARAERKAP